MQRRISDECLFVSDCLPLSLFETQVAAIVSDSCKKRLLVYLGGFFSGCNLLHDRALAGQAVSSSYP